MRYCQLCVFLFICVFSNAQSVHSFFQVDSIRMNHQTGGLLDSIDINIGVQSSTIPGGGFNGTENTFGPNELLSFPGGQRFYSFSEWKKMRFTGLPHIGFAYSFGSKGTQYVKAAYEQAFKNSVLLNMDYTKYRSNGFLRFSDFSHNDFQMQLMKTGKFYSFEFKGSYESSDVAQNGGIAIDSMANSFPLIFLPVQKEKARMSTNRIRVFQTNYFDFNPDTTKAFGLFTQHELRIKKFKYTEVDTLSGIYNVINFDPDSTYDQHQWSQISSGVGVFTKNKNHFLKVGVDAKFWNFQNLGLYRDTVELALFGLYNYSKNRLSLSNQLEFNIIGAQNEFYNRFNSIYQFNRIYLKGELLFENKLPDYYQRHAIGNNYQTKLTDPKKQFRFKPTVSIGGDLGPLNILGTYSFTALRDNYFFINEAWRNDTLTSLSFHQFGVRLNYRFKKLTIQPNYIYTLSSDNFKITPTHQFQTRLFVKGALFKARKMLAYIGLDVSVLSSFQRIEYSPIIGAFQFDELTDLSKGLTNIHIFTGFQIEEFKFFIRFENVGYFWNDRNIEMVKSYPISSNQIRIGITWDFFN